MSIYKNQTFSLIRDEPAVPVKHYALLDDLARQPRRRSRAPMTVALVVIGLLAGWIAGISLTGAFQRAKPASDVPNGQMVETTDPQAQQPDTRPATNVIAPAGKSARPRDTPAEPQPGVELQPPRATVVDEDKDKEQDDPKAEVPTGEQSTKEIGKNAIEKILKENDKIQRGKHLKANKNEE